MSGNTLRGLVKNGIRLSYSKNPLGVRAPPALGATATNVPFQPQPFMHSLSNQHQHLSFPHGVNNDIFQARLSDEFVGGAGQQQQQQHHHRGVSQAPSVLRRAESMSQGGIHPFGAGVGGGSNPNTFLSSPPPRFYSTSPGGMSFASAISTPLTGASNTFVPRSMAASAAAANASGGIISGMGMFGGSGHQQDGGTFASSRPGSFSPFGAFGAGSENHFHVVPTHQHLSQHSIPMDQRQTHADN
jgi:hypothetical protein